MENIENKIDMDKVIVGNWTKVDVENKVTEVNFSVKDQILATMKFDFANDKVSIEGDLSKVTESEDNTDFIKTYEDCSKQVLNIQ